MINNKKTLLCKIPPEWMHLSRELNALFYRREERKKKEEEKPFKRVKAECENSNWSMAAKNCAAKIGRKRRLVGKRTRGRFLLLSGPRGAGKFNWAASERFSSEMASWRPTFKSFADQQTGGGFNSSKIVPGKTTPENEEGRNERVQASRKKLELFPPRTACGNKESYPRR